MMSRVCLVGAGSISRVHADAMKSLSGHQVVSIVDPSTDAAMRLAEVCGGARVFASVREALEAGEFDRAHVLVPPDAHDDAALPLLEAGKPVLVEKPLAASSNACVALLAAGVRSGAAIGVNQNFVHHPAFAQLRRLVEAKAFGRPNFVGCVYNVSLRQLTARQFGHWMFRDPGNILLEQAVHPLSQILILAGSVQDVRALAGAPVEIAPGLPFFATLQVSFGCRILPAQLRFAVGQAYPFWQVSVVCDDGVVVADILANRVFSYERTRWIEALDGMVSGLRTAGAIARASVGNLVNYALATAKLAQRSDPFFLSMRASLGAFHGALDAGTTPELDAVFGASLVTVCETIRDQAFPVTPAPVAVRSASNAVCARAADVAVLGGTGFIGTHVVKRFVAGGLRVSVMARCARNLPGIFGHERVAMQCSDIRDAAAVARAIGSAPVVVNLAHGGGGADFAAIRAAMVGGAETVATVCLELGVRRLVHVGSIAALYLGPRAGRVTGATPPDPQAEKRSGYARAKVLADRMLLAMHANENLPVVILRPGVVVGVGGEPFHSGLGFYNNDQHCIGWNAGRNPLPFVLVEDVAEAIFLASRAESVEGRCYNIVGDARPSARDYTAELGRALERPLRFHPQSPIWLWLEDFTKWLVKRATGCRVPAPSIRDFLSRGMLAEFDCGDAQRDLGWQPVAIHERFLERAVLVHAR
jgi:predicted dehydrogenase/nucleoside-diphosphate-sugar epimerase